MACIFWKEKSSFDVIIVQNAENKKLIKITHTKQLIESLKSQLSVELSENRNT